MTCCVAVSIKILHLNTVCTYISQGLMFAVFYVDQQPSTNLLSTNIIDINGYVQYNCQQPQMCKNMQQWKVCIILMTVHLAWLLLDTLDVEVVGWQNVFDYPKNVNFRCCVAHSCPIICCILYVLVLSLRVPSLALFTVFVWSLPWRDMYHAHNYVWVHN